MMLFQELRHALKVAAPARRALQDMSNLSPEVESYISPIDAETSGHSKSMFSLRLLRAKLWRVGSGSERKPTRPAAEVKPTMSTTVVATEVVLLRVGCAWIGEWSDAGCLIWDVDMLCWPRCSEL